MKKILPIIIVIVVVGAAAIYFFMFSGDKEKPEIRVEYSPGEFFTTNVSGSSRLLKAGIILIVNDDKLEERLTAENARIRDTIIFILRDLTENEIKEPGTQDVLRGRIIDALNERLEIENFVEVLFNDFVMA
ncbi:MAG: flagellar basal body-associated FliL family protein [Oscillospiraceae bacterium]|nr:flagellar basal body-associated FliL family protein [Oscillospiraceae bacterium]